MFEKKCWCNISILNEKSSIILRTTLIAFLRVKAKILKTFLDLWFLFFVQTIKRQNLNDVSMKNQNAWRNSIFFFVRWFFFFIRRFEIFMSRLFCAHRESDTTFASRRRYSVDALLILMRFWFRHCDERKNAESRNDQRRRI